MYMSLSPYFCPELRDFDQIWYPDANFYSENWPLKKIEMIQMFQIQAGGMVWYTRV